MKKANNFQIAKAQPQGVAKLLLDFLPILVGLAYKSVSYKKRSINSKSKVNSLSTCYENKVARKYADYLMFRSEESNGTSRSE